jgi:acetylglutamate kinase
VLSGLINKELVSQLHLLGGRAIGISGMDGGLLEAHITDPELGYVGEITRVNRQPLQAILDNGYIPLIAPVAMHCQDVGAPRPGGAALSGGALNINGDTVAGELAYALEGERLFFLTDVEGIMDGGGRLIRRLDRPRAKLLLQSGVVRGGMIPKLDACLRALESGQGGRVAEIIDGRKPDALLQCVRGSASGTRITSDG